MTDEELIQNYYRGDQGALGVIFERHKDGVFNFSYRTLLNRADAEDVTSEVFSRLCAPHGQFSPTARFKTWLYTITRNACVDKIRGRQRFGSMWFQKRETGEAVQMDFPSQEDGPSQNLQNKEAGQYIQAAIEQLPTDQREALVLREFEGLSYEDIAGILRCSLANVKILIYRARTQLKSTIPSFIKEGR